MATEAPPSEEGLVEIDVDLLAELTIHQRMIGILADLPAIGKDQRNQQQNFMYRGHDDVMNALNPLLAKWGVFFVPKVLKRTVAERRTDRGKTMYEVNLCVLYVFYGAGGDSVEAIAWGEGTDMGDKSTNKAMTMALKNVLAQSFAISTEELSDADARSPEETTRGRGASDDQHQRGERKQDRSFNVGTDLLPNAKRGDEAVAELTATQQRLASNLDWPAMLEVAATACLGPKSKRTAAQRTELMYRWANTIAKLEDLADASEEYHPDLGIKAGAEGDALIVEAFKFGFGYELAGPLPLIDSEPATDEAHDAVEPTGEEAAES